MISRRRQAGSPKALSHGWGSTRSWGRWSQTARTVSSGRGRLTRVRWILTQIQRQIQIQILIFMSASLPSPSSSSSLSPSSSPLGEQTTRRAARRRLQAKAWWPCKSTVQARLPDLPRHPKGADQGGHSSDGGAGSGFEDDGDMIFIKSVTLMVIDMLAVMAQTIRLMAFYWNLTRSKSAFFSPVYRLCRPPHHFLPGGLKTDNHHPS